MTKSSNQASLTGFYWVKQKNRDWTRARFTGINWLGDVVRVDGMMLFEKIIPADASANGVVEEVPEPPPTT